MLPTHDIYMARCIQLAKLGGNHVRPNPLVGSVLVYNNKIIGEGYHKTFGEAHAEVNCLNNVSKDNVQHIPNSTLYVSLEPCFHYGKTPPCVQAIIQAGIKKVVIGQLDINPATHGKSVELLKQKGVEVTTGILEKECSILNKIFFTIQEKKRPYIQLKWAQSQDGFISAKQKQSKLSNPFSDILVHQMRSEADGILIGYNTARIDNPQLNTRLVKGNSPIRIIIDWQASLDSNLHIHDNCIKTIIINEHLNAVKENTHFITCDKDPIKIVERLLQEQIYFILIEGGSKTLQWFIDNNLWDEALVIDTNKMISYGTRAPQLNAKINYEKMISSDKHIYYSNAEFNACYS